MEARDEYVQEYSRRRYYINETLKQRFWIQRSHIVAPNARRDGEIQESCADNGVDRLKNDNQLAIYPPKSRPLKKWDAKTSDKGATFAPPAALYNVAQGNGKINLRTPIAIGAVQSASSAFKIYVDCVQKIRVVANVKYRKAARCGCVGNPMNFIVEHLS